MDQDYGTGTPTQCAECGQDLVQPFCEHIRRALRTYRSSVPAIWFGPVPDGQPRIQAQQTGGA